MIQDLEQELTTAGGQAITATAYGTRPYDLKSTHDPAVAEPLVALMKVVGADFNNLDYLDVEVYADDDGAGTNEVSVLKKTFALADLTVAKGVRRVGTIDPGQMASTNKFLRGKFTVDGSDPSTGKIKLWLVKGADAIPFNEGVKI